jgi:signal transduction histidine kinase
MTGSSLFARYWSTIAALVTCSIAAAGAVEGWFVYQLVQRGAAERQLAEARNAAYQIERAVLPILDRLAIVANIPWNYPTATDDEQLREMRRIRRQHPLVSRIQRVDRDGRVVAYDSVSGQPRDIGAATIATLGAARLRRESTGAGPFVFHPTDPTEPWAVAYLERGTDNVLVADLRTDVVNALVVRSTEAAGRFVFVTDGGGAVLAHPDLSPALAGSSILKWPGWKDAGLDSNVFRSESPIEGSIGSIHAVVSDDPKASTDWLAAYRRISNLNWVVFAATPVQELRAEVLRAVSGTAIILLTANVLALLVAIALARKLTTPLASLMRASHLVAGGNLRARAEIDGNDDIAQIGRQFNRMAEALEKSYSDLEKRVEEKTAELALANRHKSQFLAQMSHELRTPLNAIIGFSDALRAQYFGELNPKQMEYARFIQQSGQHLLSLINDLLDLAKIEAGRMDLSLSPADVREIVSSSIALVARRAEEKGIAIESLIADDISTWIADERKLKQVLVNLLSNAVKFTPSGGKVSITVTRYPAGDAKPGGLMFGVQDTGIGIPADQLSRLFTDFGQIPQTDQVQREGTGLGLALSQKLVHLHGGEIGVESEPDRGSTFWFVLPERPWPAS